MTVGNLKLRILKTFPGLDLDILDGFLADRYSEILQELAWSRLDIHAVLQLVAPYASGTIAIQAGGNAITLTGGTWTAPMTGRGFRVDGRDEVYEFAFATATTGTLDRGYEGPSAPAATYKIFQSVYPMPFDCRILADGAFSIFGQGPLNRWDRTRLNLSAPTRGEFGTPRCWASYMDDASDPPRQQVEFYPIPDTATSVPFVYTADADAPTGSGATLLPWMEPASAMVEGVTAKIYRTPRFFNAAGAQLAAGEAKAALSTMRQNEALRLPSGHLELSDYYTAHRRRRW